MGIFSIASLVIGVLKLLEVPTVVNWSWWLILIPIYSPLIMMLVALLGYFFTVIIDKKENKNEK